MSTAFQVDAFQQSAFQLDAVAPPIEIWMPQPPTISAIWTQQGGAVTEPWLPQSPTTIGDPWTRA